MTKLYYCGCRCGCTTIIAGRDHEGCTYCMEDEHHKVDLEASGIKFPLQFNPLTEIKNGT